MRTAFETKRSEMTTANNPKIMLPLYNSRILKIYAEYLKKHYPYVDINLILKYAGITNYQLEDQAHWFNQSQVDRFNEIATKKTGNPSIAREAGRYTNSSKALGPLKEYALGFMTPGAAFWMLERIAPHMTRASKYKTKKVGYHTVEVVSIPNPGVEEKPYQCHNRMGMLESLPRFFTKKFAKIEHPTCLHEGKDFCRYIISWEEIPSFMLRRLRNVLIVLGLIANAALYFLTPPLFWAGFVFFFSAVMLGIVFYSEDHEKNDLIKNIETQHGTSKLLLDEINVRYNDALLIKEIGQTISKLLDVNKLLHSIMETMDKYLEFDRGGIWLANTDRTRLVFRAGYGFDSKIINLLNNSDFHLENPYSKGMAVQSFKQQKPFLVNDIDQIEKDLSKNSLEFVKRIGTQSFICVPIVYEGESQGILLVDNLQSKKSLGQSDMSFLMGIAPQVATSIHNALSYQKLRESQKTEKSLRKLFEKYVPAPVIKRYVDSEEIDLFHGVGSSITVFFLDIRGFTSHTEMMDPKEVVSFLNIYFEKCSRVISEEKGHINKYTGDGFLAIFGAPEQLAQNTVWAFNAARRILELSKRFILGGKQMKIGIGLHTGTAILGNIGSKTKIEYTAIGDTINTAARLEEFTKRFDGFPIVMSEDAWKSLIPHPFHSSITSLGNREIRGKKEKLEIFGFNLSGTSTISPNQVDNGFKPLQRIKGV